MASITLAQAQSMYDRAIKNSATPDEVGVVVDGDAKELHLLDYSPLRGQMTHFITVEELF